MSWTNPATFSALQFITQADLNAITANLAVIGGAWTAYTPALTAATTSPTLGTGGTITGNYLQTGKTVKCRGQILFGTSPSAGSGAYMISLPAAAVGSLIMFNGTTLIFDSSANSGYMPFAMSGGGSGPGTTSVMCMEYMAATTPTFVGGAAPWTWAAGDKIQWAIEYEAA